MRQLIYQKNFIKIDTNVLELRTKEEMINSLLDKIDRYKNEIDVLKNNSTQLFLI